MHISCIILKVITKSLGGGPIHCWSKLGGTIVSPGPHGCCAYVYNPLRKQMSNRFTMNSAASVCNPYFNTRKYKPVADMARAAVNL